MSKSFLKTHLISLNLSTSSDTGGLLYDNFMILISVPCCVDKHFFSESSSSISFSWSFQVQTTAYNRIETPVFSVNLKGPETRFQNKAVQGLRPCHSKNFRRQIVQTLLENSIIHLELAFSSSFLVFLQEALLRHSSSADPLSKI